MSLSFTDRNTPQTLDEMVINDDVKHLLTTLLDMNTMKIILYGDPGMGKTTLMNVLIEEYYTQRGVDLKRFKNEYILLVDEISDTSIHNLRQLLKTFCKNTMNVTSRNNNADEHVEIPVKRTLCIDNVDTLNDATQQIIRHCISNYGDRINIIMTTSNLHRIIENIQSLVYIINIASVPNESMITFLNRICKRENILLSKYQKEYLISISNYCIQTLFTHLEKIKIYYGNSTSYSTQTIKQLCMTVHDDIFIKYLVTMIMFAKYGEVSNELFEIYKTKYLTDINMKHLRILDDNMVLRDYNAYSRRVNQLLFDMCEVGYSVIDILESFYYFIKRTSLLEEKHKFLLFPIFSHYMNIFHSIHEDEFELVVFTYDIMNTINRIKDELL